MRKTLKIFSFFFCLLSLWSSSFSVDRNNFKSCQQSGFCTRQREIKENENPYFVKSESIETSNSAISFILDSKVSKWLPLNFTLTTLENKMLRVRINEASPLETRYEIPPGDLIEVEPKKKNFKMKEKTNERIKIVENSTEIIINNDPFNVEVISEGQLVMTLNNKGLLRIEHLRKKKDQEQPKEENQEEQKEGEENKGEGEEGVHHDEGHGAWEETFKTHTDSKPKGPTSVGLDISFPGFQHVYGIPEHAESLVLKNTMSGDPYRLYNLDVFEYELYNPMSLYGAVPIMFAHNEERTLGMFWVNAAETWIDISSNFADKNVFSKLVNFVKGDTEVPVVDTHWFSESGVIDVYLVLGPSPQQAFQQIGSLTGNTPLPPLFSIAYHQCRWNYNDEDDIANVDAGFDEHDIPMDVLWLDIEYTDSKRYFTWDPHKFPTPEEMIKKLSDKERRLVAIIDPHIKREDSYPVYKQASDLGYFIKDKNLQVYDGWCWPGSSHWMDYLKKDVRSFWATLFSPPHFPASNKYLHLWIDMNEPSVFNGPEITFPKDLIHLDGWEHRDVHNIYGFYVTKASFEGVQQRSNNRERPFVLTRSFFAGSQRYAAVWTGDNTGDWSHLKASIPMLLSLSLTGMTFCGADVGGFFKNSDNELVTRWYQAGAFQPFFRAHAHMDTKRREPWLFPKEYMMAMRQAVRLRYMLLPYWYTLFYEAEVNSGPIMKPLWVDFPKDKSTFSMDDQHLVGSAILVKPVVEPGATGISVYLPGEEEVWYELDSYNANRGGQNLYIPVHLNKIPAFLRGGTIVPIRERVRRSSMLSIRDPYSIVVMLDKYGNSKGQLYHDDFETYDYRDSKFIYREFSITNATLFNSRNLNKKGVTMTTVSWIEKILFLGFLNSPKQVLITVGDQPSSSLEFSYNGNQRVLTLRKPSVNINDDFQILIS